jgi:hypothetical protein
MTERAATLLAVSFVITLLGILASGCVCVRHERTTEPVVATNPPPAQVAVVDVPSPQAEIARGATAAATIPAPSAVQGSKPVPIRPPAVIATVPTPAPQLVTKVEPILPAPRPIAAPLDLNSLATRLRQTKAIGVMTKLSLKNQIGDLLDQFRAYHKRQGTTTIAELRRSFDMLLLKVLSLLQDSDPPLARDIVKSRAAIWSILEDPRKFDEFNRMAGATP